MVMPPPEHKEKRAHFRTELPDGTVMLSYSVDDLIKKLQDYRENVN